jgi:SAM-dependent methyltransferase
MLQSYLPEHSLNRMGHEGDLRNAREKYLAGSNRNLLHLLKNRFTWMNDFLLVGDEGVELGAGIGASRDFLKVKSLLLTDFQDSEWLDKKYLDALNTGLPSESFDFIIASNLIHHLAFPKVFLDECHRLLKPGGRLIIQEIYSSFLMRLVLRIMKHEGYDETVDVFNSEIACNQVDDPWSANCSVPKKLFSSKKKFELAFPGWQIIHNKKVEFLQFLNSGGVVAKTFHIPLSEKLLKGQDKIDTFLCFLNPSFFALQNQIVLEKSSKP